MQARALLMARGPAGVWLWTTTCGATLAEMKFLRGSIGTTGLLALRPLQVRTPVGRSHRHVLEQARTRKT